MAFATSNVRLGSVGDTFSLRGGWTGSSSDASGTLAVRGLVFSAIFQNHDATSQEDRPTPCDVSYSGTTGLSTITVHNHADVSVGRFHVIFK